MSIRVTKRVWEHSRQRGNALLVMLALADFAGDDGRAWPSTSTLAKMTRQSKRHVITTLSRLADEGEIRPVGTGPRKVVVYEITPENSCLTGEVSSLVGSLTGEATSPVEGFTGEVSSPDLVKSATPLVKVISPDPLLNHQSTVIDKTPTAPFQADHPFDESKTPKPSLSAKPKKPPKQETTLPNDWQVPDDWREWMQTLASEKGVHIEADTEAHKFVDHHLAKNSKFANWQAAWRTWTRNAVQ